MLKESEERPPSRVQTVQQVEGKEVMRARNGGSEVKPSRLWSRWFLAMQEALNGLSRPVTPFTVSWRSPCPELSFSSLR